MGKMPSEIGGFSQVEYLAVFITILFGVVASEFFVGWGNMLRRREHSKPYWLHLILTSFSFLTLIQNWYGIWPRTYYINHNFLYFFYSMVPMLTFHLITVALFPSVDGDKKIDYKLYYEKNVRLLFILYAIYFTLTISSSFVYVDKGNIVAQNILRSCGVVFSLCIAYFYKVRWLQIVFAIVSYLALFQFILSIPK